MKQCSKARLILQLRSGTLTDGPTIYMTDDVVKIAKFCLQIAKSPSITSSIKNIDYNNGLSKDFAIRKRS